MKNFKDEVELFSRDTREVLKAVLKFVCFFLKKKKTKQMLQWRKFILSEQTKEADVRRVYLNYSLL